MAIMAQAGDIARALTWLADGSFTDNLSARDQQSLSSLVEEYFCSAPDNNEEEEAELEEELGT